MMDQQWNEVKDKICKQIMTEMEKISSMPSLNDATLRNLQLLTDTKKNFLKIEKLESEMGGMGGNSYRGNSYDYIRGEWGNSMDQGMRGNSNGYPMQPYYPGSYDNGYSRTDSRSHLEAAMRDARNDQEREEIRQIMSRYHN